MEERRKFVRIKDLEAVEIKIKNSSGEMERVEIKDMSINGINFYSDSEIEKDKMLKLQITLPDNKGILHIEGKVLWQLSSFSNKFATGVRFNLQDEAIKEKLMNFIHDHAKQVNETREFIRCMLQTDINISLVNNPNLKFSGQTVDISNGGMKLSVPQELEIGTRLKLSLFLPQDLEAIEVQARVVWSRKDTLKDAFDAGVIFTDINENARNKIAKYVENAYKSK